MTVAYRTGYQVRNGGSLMPDNSGAKPHGAGKSSYDLVDHEKVFHAMRLRRESTFLDMGCGPGDYAIAVAEMLGEEGVVYAADLWVEALVKMQRKAETQNIRNIRTIVGDVSGGLPIEDGTVDVCFIATVLHDFLREGVAFEALSEARRVLKKEGSLVVLEFKKMEAPPGPSIDARLAPEDVERLVAPHGFLSRGIIEVGPYHYLMIFNRTRPVGNES
jgi:ubiquinone/menaquinone biosynthesis C-methylase UbiE